jgi:hypothetical protein
VEIFVLVERSYTCLPGYVDCQVQIGYHIFWTRSLLSVKDIFLWYPFLDPHQTVHHWNLGVWLREVTKLGNSTLEVKPITLSIWHRYYCHAQKHLKILVSKWLHGAPLHQSMLYLNFVCRSYNNLNIHWHMTQNEHKTLKLRCKTFSESICTYCALF